jgi:hypothetical protein
MQHIDNLSRSAALGVARDLRNHAYEKTDTGILFPRSKLFIGGAFKHSVNDGPAQIDGNLFTTEGLNYLLNAAFGGGAQIPAFFIAPFSGNVSPVATWNGANFAANATEFTAYTDGTRPAWTEANAANAAIGNTAAQAVFTFAAGGPYNIYGMALLSASAKSSTSGILAAATRFDAPRLNQQAGDRLAVEYVITAADEGA